MSFPRYETYKESGVEWLGEVPEHWNITQLKYVVHPKTSITYGIVQAGPEVPNGIPYIKTSDMAGDKLPLEGYARTSPEIDASYQRSKVSAGDIVVAIRATVGKCLPVPPDLEGANLTQGTAKVSPGDTVLADYLLLSMKSESAQDYFGLMSKGATFKEITLDALRRTPLAFPPLSEQAQITHFLDHETARIDALIAEQEWLIELLKEKRQAVISHAVTKGLDPTVPMRDSGVEWLGEVPEHWSVSCLKRFWSVTDCKHITAEFIDDDGIPLVSIREVQSRFVNLEEAKQTTEVFYKQLIETGRKPLPGDLIFSRNATVGEFA
ncbi:MAG: restriction endonuclease subunit S, partial [Cyanobacteria bacterium P01_F01_bin.86]